jgi:hypothetical protein
MGTALILDDEDGPLVTRTGSALLVGNPSDAR